MRFRTLAAFAVLALGTSAAQSTDYFPLNLNDERRYTVANAFGALLEELDGLRTLLLAPPPEVRAVLLALRELPRAS